MKKIANRFPLLIVSATLLALAVFLSLPESIRAIGQDLQVVERTAKKYEYSTSTVRVKVGTRVQLKITAIDHDHGFKIGSVPDGASTADKTGLLFTADKECWQLKKRGDDLDRGRSPNARNIHVQVLPYLRSWAQRHERPNYCCTLRRGRRMGHAIGRVFSMQSWMVPPCLSARNHHGRWFLE